MSATKPDVSAVTVATGSPMSASGSSSAATSPPWAETISWRMPNDQPSRRAAEASRRPASGLSVARPR